MSTTYPDPSSLPGERPFQRYMSFVPLLLAVIAILNVAPKAAGIVPWILCFIAGGLAGAVLKARKGMTDLKFTRRVQLLWTASLICSVAARLLAGTMPNILQWIALAMMMALPFVQDFAMKQSAK